MNILLDEKNNVYVTDLGLSRYIPKDTDIMETMMFSGTYIYSSPESILAN